MLHALDECTDREDLVEFTNVIMGKDISNHLRLAERNMKLRRPLNLLETYQLCIRSALVDTDIHVHILEKLSNDPNLKNWPVDDQKEDKDTLMRGAKGM